MEFQKTEHQLQLDLKLTEILPIKHDNGGVTFPPTHFSFSEPAKGTVNGRIFSARLLADGSVTVHFYTEAGGFPDNLDEQGTWKTDLGDLLDVVLGYIAVKQGWAESSEKVEIHEHS